MTQTTITIQPAGHDHMMDMGEWGNGHADHEQYPWPWDVQDGEAPRRCAECGRPAYYDTAVDEYHHAVAPEIGCFLIGPSDRPADTTHPLHSGNVQWISDGWWTAQVFGMDLGDYAKNVYDTMVAFGELNASDDPPTLLVLGDDTLLEFCESLECMTLTSDQRYAITAGWFATYG